jgi:type II secretory pathway pseudopilin PulG
VVIAIIAILAAILFPVFAQAKDAAKDTAALTYAKQLGLATLIYSSDYDDIFPLALVCTSTNWDSWQGLSQPYMKNWGMLAHPKFPKAPPANTQTADWYYQIRMHWGMPLRVANHGSASAWTLQGYYQHGSTALTAGIGRRFDGIGGLGFSNPRVGGSYVSFGANPVNGPSYSQTQINNISDMVLITEANGPDMNWYWLPVNANPIIGPMNYWALWSPANIWPWGTDYSYCGAHARKRFIRCHGGNNGTGGINVVCQGTPLQSPTAWPDGLTTYVATDGSAKAKPWRGGIIEKYTLAGVDYMKSWWPN